MFLLHHVHGFCPACGSKALHIVAGSTRVHCTAEGCPRPLAADEILMENFRDHLLVIDTGGDWTLKHPLIERLDNQLLECQASARIAEVLAQTDTSSGGAGVYRVSTEGNELTVTGLP